MGGAAEGLEQRVAAPGSAFRLRSLSSTRVLDTTGLRGPGSQAGLLAARSRPGGCWPGAPSARPRVRGISHVRPLPSLAGVRAS